MSKLWSMNNMPSLKAYLNELLIFVTEARRSKGYWFMKLWRSLKRIDPFNCSLTYDCRVCHVSPGVRFGADNCSYGRDYDQSEH